MQVFSAFGFVHKITTFEKTAGFQVWWLATLHPFGFIFYAGAQAYILYSTV